MLFAGSCRHAWTFFPPRLRCRALGAFHVSVRRSHARPPARLAFRASATAGIRAVDDRHRQGKRFVAEVGINSQAQTPQEHFQYWGGVYDRRPFLDGIIVNEFIVNRPVVEWADLTPERLRKMDREREQYRVYGEAIKRMRAHERFKSRMLYAYVGGSGKKLNTEIVGTNFIPSILDCGYRVALERYLHEMSSEKGSRDALQLFTDGLADWEAKAPGVTKQMVIAFGLFSMPPGGINKQPNVDYHVWMDQQMNVVANNPALKDVAGLEWWTSLLADEETVRFVGRSHSRAVLWTSSGVTASRSAAVRSFSATMAAVLFSNTFFE